MGSCCVHALVEEQNSVATSMHLHRYLSSLQVSVDASIGLRMEKSYLNTRNIHPVRLLP